MEQSHGILLRRHRFGETSLICSWLTAEHGKLRTIAKGALRPKSPFSGKLDLFFHAELSYVRSRSSELHPLREVRLLGTWEKLSRSYRALELASYFAELMDLTTPVEAPSPDGLELLLRAYRYLESNEPDLRALQHYERELCRIHGLRIEGAAREKVAAALGEFAGRLPASRASLMRTLDAGNR